MSHDQLPNVLIITAAAVSRAHGTGVALMRQFADYPADKLANIYRAPMGDAAWSRSLHIRPEKLLSPRSLLFLAIRLKAWLLHRAQPALPCSLFWIPTMLRRWRFQPQVIYIAPVNQYDLLVLQYVLRFYPLPVIMHVLDYNERGDDAEMQRRMRELAPHLSEVWSLTRNAADWFATMTRREVPVVQVFQMDIPAEYKREHRAFSTDFSAVMVGNVWQPQMLNDVRPAWRWVCEEVGGLPPIAWYGHPDTSINFARQHGVEIEPEIAYQGFVPYETLLSNLRQADLAIIPFNREDAPESNYARYSLPSRITELASLGIPLFCVAGAKTELAHFVQEHGIGICASPKNPQHFREQLLAFMHNQELRAACGARARALAEREFDIVKYRQFLQQKLVDLACMAKQEPEIFSSE